MSKQVTGAEALASLTDGEDYLEEKQMAVDIAEDFKEFFDKFHSHREPYDDKLDAWLHKCYAQIKETKDDLDFSIPFFSPSSANSCPRELYMKVKKEKKDLQDVKPWQRRWTKIGTAIGDAVQHDILLAERHYQKLVGERPRFRMARTEEGFPAFEDFIKTMPRIEHNGKEFSLLGTSDGIMDYLSDDGELIRVGLEVKSKQTTHAQTGHYSMKGPKEDHLKQVTAYSIMYGIDYHIILYVNGSKKNWVMSDEEYEKYPDFRAFGVYVTQEMKDELLDYFTLILDLVEAGEPPKLDVDGWTFNNFKTACAKSLTDEEMKEIEEEEEKMAKSNLPDWKKRKLKETVEDIKQLRREVRGE